MSLSREPLSPHDIESHLSTLKGWSVKEGKLCKDFSFKDFISAFSFLTRVALLAEKMNHHPEIYNSYNRITLSLYTHDKKAITMWDIHFAQSIQKWNE
ncbi:MAG: 4a-hydroxytetrahydrobiopterin dehydratase [Bacteroidia bacterium]|nr:4a-hydroxytetrahydrobiopterin dehydratase [Bacteroidia bacterium]MDW8157255.1 4a-hydroxytetrahydrobiopterin dehydratase [Bacteroidia bacterium]